ncbi:MAG: hypothetical protein INR71_09355 [Terriglobus roseus]|nr:hypothetical protein [Terriglobus roseus]
MIRPSRFEHAEPAEVLTALLVARGLAWPLARCLAPWLQIVGSVRREGVFQLLVTTRVSTSVLLNCIEDTDVDVARLHAACEASLDLADALHDWDGRFVELHRTSARIALRELTTDLRIVRPSAWAEQQGLGW